MNSNFAWGINFSAGTYFGADKAVDFHIRAVRAF
jgi:hypothetical protein